uniref:pyridoxal phosphate phosphatase PHOSPHO2 n=1 Tax=Myxine glutinosa TaxID=7769 RepID=UPI00358FBECC
MKTLVVFDFDDTILDESSDDWLFRWAPGQSFPPHLLELYKNGPWIEALGAALLYLSEQGVTGEVMRQTINDAPLTPGMIELFQFLESNRAHYDSIVASDSNLSFISWTLEAARVHTLFRTIITNPSTQVDESSALSVSPFHSHSCPVCPPHLCKRRALRDFVAEETARGRRYRRVIYVGDGNNDLCPVLDLSASDVAMPRRGFALEKRLAAKVGSCKAEVVPWDSGLEIQTLLCRLSDEQGE